MRVGVVVSVKVSESRSWKAAVRDAMLPEKKGGGPAGVGGVGTACGAGAAVWSSRWVRRVKAGRSERAETPAMVVAMRGEGAVACGAASSWASVAGSEASRQMRPRRAKARGCGPVSW